MVSSSRLKSIDFYRKIPRDLTEATLSGAGLSILAALAMVFLLGMEFNTYLGTSTTTSVVVDRSKNGEFLRIEFNWSFPQLSCEFASVDINDVLGTVRLNLTKTVRKYPIDPQLKLVGSEFHSGKIPAIKSHGDHEDDESGSGDGATILTAENFDHYTHEYPVLAVNFYAPWCYWSNRLKPSWDKAANIMANKYNPSSDGRILLAKVDCTQHSELCRLHHVQGYPSIRIFRHGHDTRGDEHGHHEHESYYGERDTVSLVTYMETLVKPTVEDGKLAIEDKSDQDNNTIKRPAPSAGGCRVEGFALVKKVPGNIQVSAHSASHSFDPSTMNMSHFVTQFSFGHELSWKMQREFKRLYPILDQLNESLTGKWYSSYHENVTFEHYLQVVKTEVVSLKKRKEFIMLEQHDYVAHSATLQSGGVPVAKFHYELSPMQVLVSENSKLFSHFVTNVCAIIGGVFTVAGILDSMLHNAMRMVKKVELGKQY